MAVDVLLVILGARRLRWRELAAGNTIGYALLLQVAPGAHFIVAVVFVEALCLSL